MSATLQTAFKNILLDCLIRNVAVGATASIKTIELYAGGTLIKTLNVTSSDWVAAANGLTTLTGVPRLMNNVNAGTITSARFLDGAGTIIIDSMVAGTTGPEVVLDVAVITNAGTSCKLQSLALYWPKTLGTVQFSLAVRNRLLDIITGKQTNFPSFNGVSGCTVLGDADGATTPAIYGTALITFNSTWNAASGGALSLNTSTLATAGATGTPVCAYINYSTGGYVILCSLGTVGTDAICSASPMTSGLTYNLTAATFTL